MDNDIALYNLLSLLRSLSIDFIFKLSLCTLLIKFSLYINIPLYFNNYPLNVMKFLIYLIINKDVGFALGFSKKHSVIA